ncbi:MAG TPA: SDR family oxidoreductase [Steroidobacteraceae bacterium]|nr:SDR family oxidoreductase [Steroidobacteraceae bacterium]
MSSSTLERYFGLEGKVAVITGATGGIGRAMVEALSAARACLVISSDDAEACDRLASELNAEGHCAASFPCDVRDKGALARLVDAADHEFGGVDVLLANAGISGFSGPLGEVDDAAWNQVFEINLRHAARLSALVAPRMAARGGGSIVLTGSIAGLRGNKHIGLYGMSKAALMQLARNLAVEWGPENVRANAIAPGLINTHWAGSIMTNEQARQRRLGLTPLRRIGQPWEIAAAALFLASPGAAFMTGQTLVVDGGTVISDGN